MRLETQVELAAFAQAGVSRRAAWVAVGVAFVAILALYWRTAAEMAVVWTRSETFTHGFLVLPISLWLVWRQRGELRELPVRPWFPALLGVAGAGLLWLAADLASVASPAQFALVFMLQFAVVTVLGLPVGRALLFPLAFLLFAVPAGEFLVPKLMAHTADVTIVALRATGIPVFREGNHFAIPTGSWSVVEACSGIRYLIASMMAGSLFAYLTYRSPWKRAAFFAVSIAMPIVANWLRAYMVVMIGHLSGNKYAAGIDHLIYGWLFFGIVIAAMFWIGSLWRDADSMASVAATGGRDQPAAELASYTPTSYALAAAGTIVLAGPWLPLAHRIDAAVSPAPPGPLAVMPDRGWQTARERAPTFKPIFQGPRAEHRATFAKDGHEVGLHIAYYSRQTQGRELVNSENVLIRTDDPLWTQVGSGNIVLDWDGRPITVHRTDLHAPDEQLVVTKLYWIDGRYTASDIIAKLLLTLQKMRFRGDDAAAVILYTRQDDSGERVEQTLGRFAADMSSAVNRALEQAARRGG